MAKGRGRRAENLGAFAGGDHDQETLEKLEAAAKAANAKAGHNSGEPCDEVLRRNANAIELGLREILAAQRGVQQARADFKVARDTAKTDTGAKSWVDSMVKALKLKIAAEKGGTGEMVTEHRQIGRILRLIECPLGTQFSLFAFPDDEPGAPVPAAMDAELQGQAAYSNSEPITNNAFDPVHDTERYNDWRSGWLSAQAANARRLAATGDAEPAVA